MRRDRTRRPVDSVQVLERLQAPDCARYVKGADLLLEEHPPLPRSPLSDPREMMGPRA
jgi:hypothetical protein